MTRELPERGLLIREPYATYLVSGQKRWELRRYPTQVRGRVGIVSRRGWIGTAVLHEVLGPFTLEQLSRPEAQQLHRADPHFLQAYAKGQPLYVWVFIEPEAFEVPIPLARPPGSMVWVRLREALPDRCHSQSSLSDEVATPQSPPGDEW